MASTTAPIHSAGADPVHDKRDELLARLIYHASCLANSQVQNGLGLMHCEECEAEWLIAEPERHAGGCRVGVIRETLQSLRDAYPRQIAERSSAEPADQAAGAAVERHLQHAEYGEPWNLRTRPNGWNTASSDRFGAVCEGLNLGLICRAIACVNYCAGVPNETLASLIPLRELVAGDALGAGVDALLGSKGGAR